MHGVGMPLMNNSPSLNFLRFFDGHGNFVPLIMGIKDRLMDILAQSRSPKRAFLCIPEITQGHQKSRNKKKIAGKTQEKSSVFEHFSGQKEMKDL